ncbi:MAG: S8 family serine peptidase [Planctomycetes bacterium]|nr:S8 family serine peptidase [Planctomycetota bacterium]
MRRSFRVVWGLTLAVCMLALVAGCQTGTANEPIKPTHEQTTDQPRAKIKIEKLDDLPQHTYATTDQPSEIVKSRAKVVELARRIRADVVADLETYEIDDATTLQGMYGKLLTSDLLEGRYDDALAHLEQIKALEDKEAKKITTGLTTKAMISARQETDPKTDFDAYKQAYRRQLAQLVAGLPWDVVQDVIESSKGRLEIFSETLLTGMIQAQFDPVVAQTGELNADQAASLVGIHITLNERLPLKAETLAVYQELIDANKTVKPDIWAARSVQLPADADYTPVIVAAWDSGTDPDVFKDHLYVNTEEQLNGADDDGNGYVDDVYGVAFDIDAQRTTEPLCPLGDAAERMPQVMNHMKGFMDLQSAVDSPEASALKRHLSGLGPDEVKGFIEDLGLAGNYAHGTHVAGIMLAGNSFARLLIARLSYDHRMTPVPRTIEWGQRDAQKCRDTVEYFKQHGVRVVNMSWGEAQADAESSLERNGIGENAEQRREIARQVFKLQKEGLYEAIKNAPNILFICAAGNADNDVEFDEYIPSSFDLPNLMTVGAVDQAGEPTSFTSFGRTVQVYANGFEVESYVPGGAHMKMSGTSMSSPNVANLAAKLLVINPSLGPPEVIALIKEGADREQAGTTSILLMNPQRTVELLQSRR